MAQLLTTGGAGFIGSHTALVLLKAGNELLVFDDFSKSSSIALDHVRARWAICRTSVAADARRHLQPKGS